MRTFTSGVDAVVVDAEDAEGQHAHARRVPGAFRKARPKQVAEREEDQDHQRDDDRDERDHLQHAGAALVHSADLRRVPGAASRSATR
jgi:hypothetical protein